MKQGGAPILGPFYPITRPLERDADLAHLRGRRGVALGQIIQNGPATELQSRIASIDLIGTVAMVRLELYNWSGHRFTDLFTLLKVEGEWKIMNKVFHLHPTE